jgi:hypothetical protein
LAKLSPVHTQKQTVRVVTAAPDIALINIIPCSYSGPPLDLELDGNYISRLE